MPTFYVLRFLAAIYRVGDASTMTAHMTACPTFTKELLMTTIATKMVSRACWNVPVLDGNVEQILRMPSQIGMPPDGTDKGVALANAAAGQGIGALITSVHFAIRY